MPDPREHIWPNTFLKYRAMYHFWAPSLNGEESPNHRINHPNLSTTFWDIALIYRFHPISQWWRITLKILVVGSGSGSSPKSNQFVVVKHQTCPQNFIQIHPQLFWDILYTDKQTNKKKTSCRARYLQNPKNKFDLKNNWWLNSMTKYATRFQISSRSDENWQF